MTGTAETPADPASRIPRDAADAALNPGADCGFRRDRSTRSRLRARLGCRRACRERCARSREQDRKRAALAGTAFDFHAALMRFHDLVHHRQADAGSLDAELARLLAAAETGEDGGLFVRRYPDAAIAHRDAHAAVPALQT